MVNDIIDMALLDFCGPVFTLLSVLFLLVTSLRGYLTLISGWKKSQLMFLLMLACAETARGYASSGF